ncbi:FeoA family protein [Psychromonas sp. PT13]|uniref:FeoA family protein n=1 Tax=Psychromonas sp. PT13 TaxID=3439547 RepID=UPI003EBE9DFF
MNQAILNLFPSSATSWWTSKKSSVAMKAKNLSEAQINTEYTVKEVSTKDQSIINFLFTLGCYQGQKITLISVLSENYVITIKDARYSIDADLAKAVILD